MTSLDYLAIGHLTLDRSSDGLSVGGSVAYSCLTASRLGLRAGMVTVAGEEMDWQRELPGVEISRRPSPRSTSFENRYRSGARTQRLLAAAGPVNPRAVPPGWRSSPIVHLAPVVHEVASPLLDTLAGQLVALTPQGLLRRWGLDGTVEPGRWAGSEALLARCQVVVVSEEDMRADPDFLGLCIRRVPITLVTRGPRGAVLHHEGEAIPFPACPADEVEPTGAGDVFAAAFLVEYYRTGNPCASTAFACCAAAFAVERPGLAGVPPDRPAVEARLARYRRDG